MAPQPVDRLAQCALLGELVKQVDRREQAGVTEWSSVRANIGAGATIQNSLSQGGMTGVAAGRDYRGSVKSSE